MYEECAAAFKSSDTARLDSVPHMVYTYIPFSRSILQSITGADLIGLYQSANPREIVSYDRAGVAWNVSTSTYFHAFLFSGLFEEAAKIRVSEKNNVARLARRIRVSYARDV